MLESSNSQGESVTGSRKRPREDLGRDQNKVKHGENVDVYETTDGSLTPKMNSETGPISIWKTTLRGDKTSILSPSFTPEKFSAIKLKVGQAIPLSVLSMAFHEIEALKNSGSGSKKKMIIILSNCMRIFIYYNKEELLPALYIITNKLKPDYLGVELGVGEHIVLKAMSHVYGRTHQSIESEITNGNASDLGEAAILSRLNQSMLMSPPALTVKKLYDDFLAIANLSGQQSGKKRFDIISRCLVAARGYEGKYIVRSLLGKMRIGILHTSALQSLAYAIVLTSPTKSDAREDLKPSKADSLYLLMTELEESIKQAYSEVPSLDILVESLQANPDPSALRNACSVRIGVPVKPMLAKPSKSISEILDRFTGIEFTGEFKYDGERAQVHLDRKSDDPVSLSTISIFSRNSEDMTQKYPDVKQVVLDMLDASVKAGKIITSFILDCEIVSYDVQSKQILPFQALANRGKKNVKLEDIKTAVCLFPFDILLFNGNSMLHSSLYERRNCLHDYIVEIESRIHFAEYRNMDCEEEIFSLFNESIGRSCEGLMLKTLHKNATYEPSKRTHNWLKLKKDYLSGMADTLDLVPIGAYYGRGKRAGVFGSYLLAVWDGDDGQFQTCCKAGTGFSESDLKTFTDQLTPHIINSKRIDYIVNTQMEPDVWFDAKAVWEIECADLSESPVHTGAQQLRGDGGRGIGLRFPRFLRSREDKTPCDASTSEDLLQFYSNQFNKNKARGENDIMDDDC